MWWRRWRGGFPQGVAHAAKSTTRTRAGQAPPNAAGTKNAVRRASLDIIIQSPMGGAISTDDIAKKIPKGANAVYVRVDENKLYWVKGKETGDVDIW